MVKRVVTRQRTAPRLPRRQRAVTHCDDVLTFLVAVYRDPTVPTLLRVQAAAALLPYFHATDEQDG